MLAIPKARAGVSRTPRISVVGIVVMVVAGVTGLTVHLLTAGQILHMADMLSDGLIAQFPGKFAR